jgi:hypothetical protein
MKISEKEIINTMRIYGGGFASALAVAASHADYDNRERLKRAFPDYWQVFESMAASKKSKLERDDA